MEVYLKEKWGDADVYLATLDDGSKHHVVISGCQKAVAGDGGMSDLARAIRRLQQKSAA